MRHCGVAINLDVGRYWMGDDVAMITLHQVEIGYGNLPLFPPLSGYFSTGSLTAIIGVNGAGKSTLLRALVGLHTLQAGSLQFANTVPPKIAYLPQQTVFDCQFPVLVSDLVAMGNWANRGMFRGLSKIESNRIVEALEFMDMANMANILVGELSYGQLKRALFARLLVQQPTLILLDEPFNGVDISTVKLFIQVIEQLHQQGKTLIAALHDMSIVNNHFPNLLLLTSKYCSWGYTDQVLQKITSLISLSNFSIK